MGQFKKKCDKCGFLNSVDHFNCDRCGRDLSEADIVESEEPDKAENAAADPALAHDFPEETILESSCIKCGAINPTQLKACLFCGGELESPQRRGSLSRPVFSISEVLAKKQQQKPEPEQEKMKRTKKLVSLREKGVEYILPERGSSVMGREGEWSSFWDSEVFDKHVSRQHFMITTSDTGTKITQIGSSHPTFIRVGGRYEEVRTGESKAIINGTVIRIGTDDGNPSFPLVRYEEC